MADPISVLGAATAVITLVELVGHAISSLSELRDQWKDADILFASLVAQLTALKAALCKIHNWISGSADLDYQFRMDLEVSLTCCKMLINRLGLFLSEIRGRNDSQDNIRLDTRSRIKLLVMKGGPMEEILGMVDRQIPVLNLLLTACNWLVTKTRDDSSLRQLTRADNINSVRLFPTSEPSLSSQPPEEHLIGCKMTILP